MAGPGRPPKSLQDLDSQLSAGGDVVVAEPIERPKKKPRDSFIFEMIGSFPRDPQNGTTRYPGLQLGNSQVVFDKETGTQRTARLLRGIHTIWQDEQKDITEKIAARNKPHLSFDNGQLIVPASDKNTIKYLMLCSDFAGCEHPVINRRPRYRLLDTEAEEAQAFEKKKRKKDASELAWNAPYEHLVPHAKYLGIMFVNEKGLPKSEEALRSDYVDKAEAQPDLFLNSYNNPKVKMYGLVKAAFEANKIIYVDGQAQWTDTKAVICQVPHEKQNNVADFLAAFMLTKDGLEFRTRLENK